MSDGLRLTADEVVQLATYMLAHPPKDGDRPEHRSAYYKVLAAAAITPCADGTQDVNFGTLTVTR